MFQKTDFCGDNVTRLQVIVMNLMGKNVLTNFKELMQHEKRKFNFCLNAYINALPEEWQDKILEDFNAVCNDYIYNEKFDAMNFLARELISDIQLLEKNDSI
jgi:hypothetical protein